MDQTSENGLHLEKFVTLLRTCHTLENRPHYKQWVLVEKYITLGTMGHTWKSGSNLEKWVTLGKMGQSSGNGSHLEKCVTHGRICQSLKNGSHLEQ